MELKSHHHVRRHKITELGYKGVSKCLRQMPLQSHLNTTLLITNILKMLLINGAGVVRGWSGTRVEWYEKTERKRRGTRALKGCKSRQESQDGSCAKELLQKNH